MKIVQVLTYVSIDGAYGGPVAVARAQTRELAARGHDVTLVAGWDGRAELVIPGVDVRLFKVRRIPRLGFAGMFSLPLLWAVRTLARDADIVHLHRARDLVQVGACLGLGSRGAVLQCHGMVREDSCLPARVVDRLVLRRAFRQAVAHLVLVSGERQGIEAVSGGRVPVASVFSVRNGVPLRETLASWTDDAPRVVYISRLHPRKRPVAFVEMADVLVREGHPASFLLYGGDEGERGAVLEAIRTHELVDRVSCPGPLEPESVLDVMAAAQVFVLPSFDEPFPMAGSRRSCSRTTAQSSPTARRPRWPRPSATWSPRGSDGRRRRDGPSVRGKSTSVRGPWWTGWWRSTGWSGADVTRQSLRSGSHQLRWSRYHATVSARPASKPTRGSKPSSVRILVASTQ